MAELTVDLTYGTALMEAARELGKEDQILDEAQAVAQLIEEEPDLHKFINYPGVSADEQILHFHADSQVPLRQGQALSGAFHAGRHPRSGGRSAPHAV